MTENTKPAAGNVRIETLDITPNWRGHFDSLLVIWQHGDREGRAAALSEFQRIADFLDANFPTRADHSGRLANPIKES